MKTKMIEKDRLSEHRQSAATTVVGEYLVEPGWLVEHLDLPDLLVVDCRFIGDRESSKQAYRDGHIPGAVHVYWLDELCAPDTRVTTLLPDPARAADGLGRLGVGADTLVVSYADHADLYAARLWHVLRCNGHPHVLLLNGGIDDWSAAGGPLQSGENRLQPAVFPLRTPLATVIGTDEILGRLGDRSMQLVDARSRAEYDGVEIRAARGGHIPGAVLLPWDELIGADHRFLPAAAIVEKCEHAGLNPDQEIVTYCQGGVRAAHLAFSLQLAGFDRVRVYDGSWAVWGNDPDLPVATPTHPSS